MTRKDTRIIHTDGLEEGIRCAMCTNPMANNRGCDGGCDINESMYKRVLDVIKKNILEQEPCEDCISREATLDAIIKRLGIKNETYLLEAERVIYQQILAMPSVNPQKSKEGYISIDNVMSVFDDFMCGEVDEDGTEIFLEMLKDKAESEDKE